MKFVSILSITILLVAVSACSAQQSPGRTATGTIAGKTISIRYSAPSVRGRKIFGEGGLVMKDRTAPVWRAGANAATTLHTDADLSLGGLAVPKGDYSLYVNVKDPDAWVLIVNKQTGQSGLAYDASQDLGRVDIQMSKPPAPVEQLKYEISDDGGNKGTLRLEWENHIASVAITVK